MNGTTDGFHQHVPSEDSFMFTSESVGEGHPGECEDHPLVHQRPPEAAVAFSNAEESELKGAILRKLQI